MFLTQHPSYDVVIKVGPINKEDALTEDEQKAEGVEEGDIIKYFQEFKLFNTSDYIGKSKGLSFNYNKNMKIDLYKQIGEEEDLELLDTFTLTDVVQNLDREIDQ